MDGSFDIFTGPIYDQDGTLRVKEGEVMSLADLAATLRVARIAQPNRLAVIADDLRTLAAQLRAAQEQDLRRTARFVELDLRLPFLAAMFCKGIADGVPFEILAEGRRTGAC